MTDQDLSALYKAPSGAVSNQQTEGTGVPLTGVREVRDLASGATITVDDRTFNPAWHAELTV